jgi:capsular polysaccharide biosynthesis protein/Mrp family chromosome partitioning ATPase
MSSWRIGFLSIAARWWAVLVLAAVGGGLTAYLLGSAQSPTYEAEARLLVVAPEPEVGSLQTAAELAPTYAELARSAAVLRRTAAALGGRITFAELRDGVRGETSRDTHLVTVRVRSGDPAVAVQAANELARQLVREASTPPPVAEGETPTARTRLEIVDPATEASKVRPRAALLAWLGALAGFFLALGVAVFVDSRRRTVRAEEDLAELTSGAVLGSVEGGRRSSRVVGVGGSAASNGTGSYRRLVERIVAAGDGAPRSVLVVGADRHAGSGTVAANLAATWADAGLEVVLADLGDTPDAVRLFASSAHGAGGEPAAHAGSLFYRGIDLDCFEARSDRAPLLVLPQGDPPRSLESSEARGLVKALHTRAELAVIHAGPPEQSPRSLALARAAELTILVVRRGRTDRGSVASTIESLELAQAGTVATVLNTSPRRS